MTTLSWKQNWPETQTGFTRWWNREGMLIYLTANSPAPRTPELEPERPADITTAWLDPVYRRERAEHDLSRTHFLAEAFPIFDTQIGPGSLSTFLGARPEFAVDTVWYWPCIMDPERYGPIRFSTENNPWLDAHLALVDEGIKHANGRYLVSIPDMIENLDTLASLRGDSLLMFDLIERPAWVMEKIAEINQAYFAFHGTYADAPGSTTPIGDQLRALQATSTSLGDFLNTAAGLRTYDDLLELLEERGVERAQAATPHTP